MFWESQESLQGCSLARRKRAQAASSSGSQDPLGRATVFLPLLASGPIPEPDFLRAWGREGVVSGDIFSLRQEIFKGKIIFLVCRFRRPIKTIFLCISLFHWVGRDVGIGRMVPCLPAVPGSQAISGGMSP